MSSDEVDASKAPDMSVFIGRIRHEGYQDNPLVRVNSEGQQAFVFFYPALTVTKNDVITGVASLMTALVGAFSPAE
jgi:hypothetical protein